MYDYIYESDKRKGKPKNPTIPEVFDSTIDPYRLQRILEERIDYNYMQGKLVDKVVSTHDKVIIFFSHKNFVINLVQN